MGSSKMIGNFSCRLEVTSTGYFSNSTGSSVTSGWVDSPFIGFDLENTSYFDQWSRRILGIITGWDPSVCKSGRLHVHILWSSFIKLVYILWVPLKWSVIFLQSWWTSTGYFSNSTGSSVTNCWFSRTVVKDEPVEFEKLPVEARGFRENYPLS